MELSLITSFCATGIAEVIDPAKPNLIRGTRNIEVYAFMQGDLGWVFEGAGVTCALEAMANECASPELVAERLNGQFAHQTIVAFSTFLPELTGRLDVGKAAESALIFLVNVISCLRSTYGHPVATLELVAGSATAGINISEISLGQSASWTFSLMRIGKSEAVELLLTRTRNLADEAHAKGVNLAIELEPGPLFTIGTFDDLLNLCRMIKLFGSAAQNLRLGLNLDIPHWAFLAGIDIPTLRDTREGGIIMERVVHAHISDHNKGHFCDKAPDGRDPARTQAFQEWIDFLKRQVTSPRGNLAYSGYISLELECCNSIDDLNQSLDYFGQLI